MISFSDILERREFFRNQTLPLIFFLFSLLFFFGAGRDLFADTVVMKNGKEFINVKTKLIRKKIIIQTESGKEFNHSVEEIKALKVVPVKWAQVHSVKSPPIKPVATPIEDENVGEEKLKSPEESAPSLLAEGNISEITNQSFFKSPVMIAAQSAIPGWSGLYSKNRKNLGLLFSIVELYGAYRFYPWTKPKKQYFSNEALFFYTTYYNNITGGGPPPPLLKYSAGMNQFWLNGAASINDYTFLYLLTKDYVVNPVNPSQMISRKDYVRQKSMLASSLLFAVSLDMIVSLLMDETTSVSAAYRNNSKTVSFQFLIQPFVENQVTAFFSMDVKFK